METKPKSWYRNSLIRGGICGAVYDRMKNDPTVYLIGEGAHMKVHYDAPKIEKDFSDRVLTLPISEDGNTNFAVGLALMGLKPINDLITSDFVYRSMDSICNTAAKMNFIHQHDPKTLVIRAEYLIGGPTSGQRPEALFTHIPGLRVAVPSNPLDAYGLMSTALTTPGITIFFEDRMINDSDTLESDKLIEGDHTKMLVPFGAGEFKNMGNKLTIVSYALTLKRAENVVKKNGYDVDLIDLRTLAPLDISMIEESLNHTGDKLLVIEPDTLAGGIGTEIVTRSHPSQWKVVSAPNITIPASAALHDAMIPSEEVIHAAIKEML